MHPIHCFHDAQQLKLTLSFQHRQSFSSQGLPVVEESIKYLQQVPLALAPILQCPPKTAQSDQKGRTSLHQFNLVSELAQQAGCYI